MSRADIVLVTLILLGAGGCAFRRADEVLITLAYDRGLKLRPCSCEVIPRGGVLRESKVLKRLRAEAPRALHLGVSAGTTFVPLPASYLDSELHVYRRKAYYVARALKELGTVAVGASMDDFKLGAETLRRVAAESGVGIISANVVDAAGEPLLREAFATETDGAGFVFVGLTAYSPLAPSGARWITPEVALERALSRYSGGDRFVAVLSDLPSEEILRMAKKFPRVSLWLGAKEEGIGTGSRLEQYSTEVLIASPSPSGASLIALRFGITGDGWHSPGFARSAARSVTVGGASLPPEVKARLTAVATRGPIGARHFFIDEIGVTGVFDEDATSLSELLREKADVWERWHLTDFE